MCRKGEALELSYDHKPAAEAEKKRIEAAGGHLEEPKGLWKGWDMEENTIEGQ